MLVGCTCLLGLLAYVFLVCCWLEMGPSEIKVERCDAGPLTCRLECEGRNGTLDWRHRQFSVSKNEVGSADMGILLEDSLRQIRRLNFSIPDSIRDVTIYAGPGADRAQLLLSFEREFRKRFPESSLSIDQVRIWQRIQGYQPLQVLPFAVEFYRVCLF